ncbi:MAG: hypothetical protein ACXIVE_00740 [Salinarimonas sp.]
MANVTGFSDAFGLVINRLVDRALPAEDPGTVPTTCFRRFLIALAGGLFITLIIVVGYGNRAVPVGSPAAATGLIPVFVGVEMYFAQFRPGGGSIVLYVLGVIILAALFVYSYIIALSLTRRGPLTLLIAGSALPILMLSLGKIALS